jgi:hypothetical protein
MFTIREKAIAEALDRAFSLLDYNEHNDGHKQHEFIVQTILADESLTPMERMEALKEQMMHYDRFKILYNTGKKRICENCNQKCLATLYCEICVRRYLKANSSNWTSGNDNIDNLIQECQSETLMPEKVIEWIPYKSLKNVKYLTEGGCSKIYKAVWVDGRYCDWDSNEQQLIKRQGLMDVVLKGLVNIENADRNWFEEVCNLDENNN